MKLWKVLDKHEVKGKLLRAIQALCVGSRTSVKVGLMVSEQFDVRSWSEARMYAVSMVF